MISALSARTDSSARSNRSPLHIPIPRFPFGPTSQTLRSGCATPPHDGRCHMVFTATRLASTDLLFAVTRGPVALSLDYFLDYFLHAECRAYPDRPCK